MNYLITQKIHIQMIKIEMKKIRKSSRLMKTNVWIQLMKSFSKRKSKKYKKNFWNSIQISIVSHFFLRLKKIRSNIIFLSILEISMWQTAFLYSFCKLFSRFLSDCRYFLTTLVSQLWTFQFSYHALYAQWCFTLD